ncbi:MAG: hypothetical protein AAFP04_05690 [Myxococcota bacterium]
MKNSYRAALYTLAVVFGLDDAKASDEVDCTMFVEGNELNLYAENSSGMFYSIPIADSNSSSPSLITLSDCDDVCLQVLEAQDTPVQVSVSMDGSEVSSVYSYEPPSLIGGSDGEFDIEDEYGSIDVNETEPVCRSVGDFGAGDRCQPYRCFPGTEVCSDDDVGVFASSGWDACGAQGGESFCDSGGVCVRTRNKRIVKTMNMRPGFIGSANNMGCQANQHRAHTISWKAIRTSYYAAVNPLQGYRCIDNLRLLYRGVKLNPDAQPYLDAITAACSDANLSHPFFNQITNIDIANLNFLNSSIENLRCGWGAANSSIGSYTDVPLVDQWPNAYDRVSLAGDTKDQILYMEALSASSLDPSAWVYLPAGDTGNHTCEQTLAPGSTNYQRLITSDCKNDRKSPAGSAQRQVFIPIPANPPFPLALPTHWTHQQQNYWRWLAAGSYPEN